MWYLRENIFTVDYCQLLSVIICHFLDSLLASDTALPPHSSPSLHWLTKISALSVVAGGGQVLTVHISAAGPYCTDVHCKSLLYVQMYTAGPQCTYIYVYCRSLMYICMLQVLTVQMYNACSYHTDLHCRSILDICSIWVLSVRMYTVGSYCVLMYIVGP